MKAARWITVLGGLTLIALVWSRAAASGSAQVRGIVTAASNGSPIAGANISLPLLGIGSSTGPDGTFALSVDLGTDVVRPTTLIFSAPGFGDWTIENVRLVAGDTLKLEVEMASTPTLVVVPEPRSSRAPLPAAQFQQGFQGEALASQLEEPLPSTIRVRVTGYAYCDTSREYTVETIDFREYAKHVLPNEWVTNWPYESLRAGAMAVKMYAWSYIAVGGKWPDADVYDSTCDQVYIPSVSYSSTDKAVDFTWNWRLTRGDQLLRTFYRAYLSQCEDVGLGGSCMGQIESMDMAYDRYTWDEILYTFYDNSALSPVWDPPGGYSLRFYGNGYGDLDRVKVAIDPQVPADVGDAGFTLEWWMKALPGENGSSGCSPGASNWFYGNTIFDRDIYGDGDHGDYGVSLAGGRIAFGIGRGQESLTICSASDIADGQWHHIAVTRELSGAMKIFVDGSLEAEGVGPAGDITYRDGRASSWLNDPYLVIGAEKNDLDNTIYPSFSGWLDEIRISSAVRYAVDFTPPTGRFTPDFDTAALYHFNEGVGNQIGDSSGVGPSDGVRIYGGVLNGPEWTTDTFWYVAPPTPVPTATSTPIATQTQTPGSTPAQSPTYTQTATEPTGTTTQSPTSAPTSTPTPMLTSTSEPTGTAIPSPTVTAAPFATNTSEPTGTAIPSPTVTAAPSSTSAPVPTSTPVPSTTPSPASPTETSTSQASSTPEPTQTSEPATGDINGDGLVNVLDIQICVNVFLGSETDPVRVSRSDVNGDGGTDVRDVQAIANLILAE